MWEVSFSVEEYTVLIVSGFKQQEVLQEWQGQNICDKKNQ